jgi:phospholipid/cholesterol/gamma-HCH transport system ATP-binding protein
MRSLSGLDEPLGGKTTVLGVDLATAAAAERAATLRRLGFLFQGSALFSSLTLLENVELPLREFLGAPRRDLRALAEYKLALVGLADAMDKLPSEIFLDEPSAGLDPMTSGRLDELILKLREAFGTTLVLVSHEVPSILRIADFCVYLDPDAGRMGAYGPPRDFLSPDAYPKAHAFFSQARIP